MKIQANMTTVSDDMDRYSSREDICEMFKKFDGLELMYFGDHDFITPDMVTGVHLNCKETWLDFWLQDEERLIAEFDDLQTVERFYGSLDPHILVDKIKENMRVAHKYGAEYVVYHVCETTIPETLTFTRSHTNEEVIDALCDLMNEVFEDEDGSVALLLENLWYSGLTITDPTATKRLMDGIRYPNKGIMFDTGHLLHTNLDLRSQEEGLEYINRMLDEHEQAGLLNYFRGMHLQQSITGEFCKELIANPVELAPTWPERNFQVFTNIFKIDLHQPFTCKGVRQMVDRLPLEYLTFEYITDDRHQHQEFIDAQWAALEM